MRFAVMAGLCLSLPFPWAGGAETSLTDRFEPAGKPHRLVVLTDIEADPDDTQTLVRLLLYSNEIDIQGLIATTSVHQKTTVAPQSIRDVIGAYAAVYDNLLGHDSRYPTAGSLLALVKQGLPVYGMQGVGDGKSSEGSDWIIRTLEQDDDRPLWVSVWGGVNTLAQALHEIKARRPAPEVDRLVARLRVYTISDQDDSGIWIRKNFPNLFYIVSPGGYGAAVWTGIHHVVPGFDNTAISNAWIAQNIQQGHGPLGATYPDVTWSMEGDTPAWLSLIPNGLNSPEHPDWGGWGGRYKFYIPERSAMDPDGFTGGVPVEEEPRAIWTNAVDEYIPPVAGEYGRANKTGDQSFKGYRTTVWRWRNDFQNDFAARMDWTIRPFDEANHPPMVRLDGPDRITVKSGRGFALSARPTTDPDGDSLSYYWFEYPEAGTCKTPLTLNVENSMGVYVTAPMVEQTETAHIILRVTDKGSPPLSRYQRVIVTINP